MPFSHQGVDEWAKIRSGDRVQLAHDAKGSYATRFTGIGSAPSLARIRNGLRGGRLREHDQRDLAGSGPLCSEAFAAVYPQATGRIESENALLLVVDAHDHLVMRVRAPTVAFHHANQDRMM